MEKNRYFITPPPFSSLSFSLFFLPLSLSISASEKEAIESIHHVFGAHVTEGDAMYEW